MDVIQDATGVRENLIVEFHDVGFTTPVGVQGLFGNGIGFQFIL